MNSFLTRFPKLLVALVVISLATALIIYQNPPHTVCQIQMADFQTSMQGILIPKIVNKKSVPAVYNSARDACRYGNSTGACSDYIQLTLRIGKDLRKLNSECLADFAKLKNFKAIFDQFTGVLVYGAWGSKAPEENSDRFGWLTEADIAAFCRVKDLYVDIYGKSALDSLMTTIFADLPGSSEVDEVLAKSDSNRSKSKSEEDKPAYRVTTKTAYELFQTKGVKDPRTEIWKRSLFSARCEYFR